MTSNPTSHSQTQEPIPGVKRTLLLKQDLLGIEGHEASVRIVELSPGAVVGKHYHPGEQLDYVLSGSGTLEVEGKSPLALKSGSRSMSRPGRSMT